MGLRYTWKIFSIFSGSYKWKKYIQSDPSEIIKVFIIPETGRSDNNVNSTKCTAVFQKPSQNNCVSCFRDYSGVP